MAYDQEEARKRRIFRKVKQMTYEQFWAWVEIGHTNAYDLSSKHHEEALFMESPPRIQEAVLAKVRDIREGWDNIKEVNLKTTGTWDKLEEVADQVLKMKNL